MTFIQPRTGVVWIDNFDRGVVETLGAVVNTAGNTYVIKEIEGVAPPPDVEGIPVFFAFSDDTIDHKILPSFVIRRDSISPAMARWHLGCTAYRVPAPAAREVVINNPRTGDEMARGYDQYEMQDQAVPFDILYTIQIRARFRNSLRVEAQKMLRYAMRIYQPYCRVIIKDSLGESRGYDAFMENPSIADRMTDVSDRETTFNMSLRVEAELDLNDPFVLQSLTSLPNVRYDINRGS
jgi:hypothetical protein